MLGNTKILALCFGLSAAPGVLAQTTPPATKIGIAAIQQAIANTNEGKKELEALQQRFAPKQAEIRAQNDEVDKLKQQLQTQGEKLSDEERTSRLRTIEAKQKLLQRNFDDAQTEYQQAGQDVVSRLGEKMKKVLENYGKTNGYAVILDVSNPQTTPVMYASTDVTKDLIDAYNAQNPVAAPAAKAPVTPAAPPK